MKELTGAEMYMSKEDWAFYQEVPEETMVLDGKLIDGLTDDLDDFLQHLLEED